MTRTAAELALIPFILGIAELYFNFRITCARVFLLRPANEKTRIIWSSCEICE